MASSTKTGLPIPVNHQCVIYDLLPSHTCRNECGPLKKTKHNYRTSSNFQAYRLGQLSQASGQKSEFRRLKIWNQHIKGLVFFNRSLLFKYLTDRNKLQRVTTIILATDLSTANVLCASQIAFSFHFISISSWDKN